VDKWSVAFTAIGGLAAVGGLIDLAMYKSEKDKLKALLEEWWLRFMDVKWSNFGRKEAELAVQILDRWAGPDMGYRKRWRFALIVVTVALVLVLSWSGLRALWSPTNFAFTSEPKMIAIVVAIVFGANVIGFVFSLSLTRFVAKWVARFSRGTILTIGAFCLLLAIHVALLLYWSLVVYGFQILIMYVYVLTYLVMSNLAQFEAPNPQATQALTDLLNHSLPNIFTDFYAGARDGGKMPIPHAPTWAVLFDWHNPDIPFASIVTQGVKVLMDIIANGLRIIFALVFLSSFVFRPLIQDPISRLWYGAMDSGKPTFTMLFGAVGTVLATARILTA
jgi:hypothetical protein